jgi:hypothetical protein
MGVNIFRETAPDNFITFFRALSTMFRLTAGETWVDGLAAYDESGTPYYGTALFIYSYIVIVVWILLQVSVAVLLVPPPLPPQLRPVRGSCGGGYGLRSVGGRW